MELLDFNHPLSGYLCEVKTHPHISPVGCQYSPVLSRGAPLAGRRRDGRLTGGSGRRPAHLGRRPPPREERAVLPGGHRVPPASLLLRRGVSATRNGVPATGQGVASAIRAAIPVDGPDRLTGCPPRRGGPGRGADRSERGVRVPRVAALPRLAGPRVALQTRRRRQPGLLLVTGVAGGGTGCLRTSLLSIASDETQAARATARAK